jgi:hypothetical protein
VTADPAVTGGHPDASGAVQADAWFRIDAEQRALAWGSEGPHDYHGELQVTPDGGNARVSLRLHTEHDATEQIEHGIESTLSNIEHLVTNRDATG